MHSLDEGADALRVHVRVKAMAQVGDVASSAKTFQHLLHNVEDALLEDGRGEERVTALRSSVLVVIENKSYFPYCVRGEGTTKYN